MELKHGPKMTGINWSSTGSNREIPEKAGGGIFGRDERQLASQ
jgi:hypothetical protein